MRSILGIFGKSPFGHLQQHMRKVKECVDRIIPLIEALIKGDYVEVEKEASMISTLEHKADLVKDIIRNELPKNIFMPVSRSDLLSVLSCQDDISDTAEDIGVLLTMKKMKLPKELTSDLEIFLNNVMIVCNQAFTIMEEIDELVETSFRGLEAKKVMQMIDELGTMEFEADKKQLILVKKLLSMEDSLKPLDIFMWMKIFEGIGDLANNAERLGNRLRLMLSQG